MVGRLIESKHHDKLIEMFARVVIPGWKLLIVGYDHLKQKNMSKLKKLISELNVEDRVILVGKQKNVDYYYLKSKIFAFTSSSEGFPNAIGEAISAGLPVVTYDCIAGPSEMIINSSTGFLIPLFDRDQFREKLELLMRSKELREKFGIHGQRVIEKFIKDHLIKPMQEGENDNI